MGERPGRAFSPTHVVMLGAVLLVAVTALMVTILHKRAIDPMSGLQNPNSHSTELNHRAQQRSTEFVDALRRGDVARMKAMADGPDDRAVVDDFQAAFGGRKVMITGMESSGFADSSVFTRIAVPCRDGSEQQALVIVVWKKTSYFSSDWFAFLHPPGEKGTEPAGCPAP